MFRSQYLICTAEKQRKHKKQNDPLKCWYKSLIRAGKHGADTIDDQCNHGENNTSVFQYSKNGLPRFHTFLPKMYYIIEYHETAADAR